MNKKKIFVICLDAAVVLLALAAGPLTRMMIRLLPDCLVMRLGFLCPACGGTRCVQYLFSGRVVQAYQINPYIFLTAVYLAILLLVVNGAILFGRKPMEKALCRMVSPQVVIVWAVGFVVFGIFRNIL